MSQGFVHLRLHTEYSLSDSVVRIPELVTAVAAAGMPAVAVTDQSNLFAMVKFYREALRNGVKPIVGIDLWVAEEGERAAPSRLTLLCQSQEGYRNLARLVSRATESSAGDLLIARRRAGLVSPTASPVRRAPRALCARSRSARAAPA